MADAERHREFEFTDRDFRAVRELVYEHTGISLGENKRDLVYGRLSRRLRQLGLQRFTDYLSRVEGGTDATEFVSFINSLTTNTTSFFREPHQFEYLAGTALPELLKRHRDDRRIRIWSAGCSSGQEPYTIAMVVREVVRPELGFDVKILATDLDSDILARAKAGVYKEEELEPVSKERRTRWFQKGEGPHAGQVRVAQELRDLVTFNRLNFMHDWPMRGPFDCIFFRNVAIYFEKPTQEALIERFSEKLAPSGWLFVGHSESLLHSAHLLELCGRGVYRRRG